MTKHLWAPLVIFVGSLSTAAQEPMVSCGGQTVAVITEIRGHCSCREQPNSPSQLLDRKKDLHKRLLAGCRMQCEGKGQIKVYLCNSHQERPIAQNPPRWFILPNIPNSIPDPKDKSLGGSVSMLSPFLDSGSRAKSADPTSLGAAPVDFFRPRNPETRRAGFESNTPAGDSFAYYQADRANSIVGLADVSIVGLADVRATPTNAPTASAASAPTPQANLTYEPPANMSERPASAAAKPASVSKPGGPRPTIEKSSTEITLAAKDSLPTAPSGSTSIPKQIVPAIASTVSPSSPNPAEVPAERRAEVTLDQSAPHLEIEKSRTGLTMEDLVELHLNSGNQARDLGYSAGAERSYNLAALLKPDEWRPAFGLGNVFTDQQNWEQAEQAYRHAIELNPSAVDAYVALSFVLLQPRAEGDPTKRLAEAEGFARRAIELNNSNALAFDLLGISLEKGKKADSNARRAYERAIELNPNFTVAYVHLARLSTKLGYPNISNGLYRKATSLAHDPLTLIFTSENLQADQRFRESEGPLERALKIDSQNSDAVFLLVRALVYRRQYNKAIPFLRRAIERSPSSFPIRYLLGLTYLLKDDLKSAEQALDNAIKTASSQDRKFLGSVNLFESIGDGYSNAGLGNEAVRVYERALTLDPDNSELKKKLTEARKLLKP